MTAYEMLTNSLNRLEEMRGQWRTVLGWLQSPRPCGHLGTNGVRETTEQAIARMENWIERETLASSTSQI